MFSFRACDAIGFRCARVHCEAIHKVLLQQVLQAAVADVPKMSVPCLPTLEGMHCRKHLRFACAQPRVPAGSDLQLV